MFKSLGNPEGNKTCGICIGVFSWALYESLSFLLPEIKCFVFLRMKKKKKKKKNLKNITEMLRIFERKIAINYIMN